MWPASMSGEMNQTTLSLISKFYPVLCDGITPSLGSLPVDIIRVILLSMSEKQLLFCTILIILWNMQIYLNPLRSQTKVTLYMANQSKAETKSRKSSSSLTTKKGSKKSADSTSDPSQPGGSGSGPASTKLDGKRDRRAGQGLNPRAILTGFYGPTGSKVRRTVYDGALRVPSHAPALVRDSLARIVAGWEEEDDTIDAEAFRWEGTKRRVHELPGVDSVTRPSLDALLGPTFIVTELRTSDLGATVARNIRVPVLPNPDNDAGNDAGTHRIRGGGGEDDGGAARMQGFYLNPKDSSSNQYGAAGTGGITTVAGTVSHSRSNMEVVQGVAPTPRGVEGTKMTGFQPRQVFHAPTPAVGSKEIAQGILPNRTRTSSVDAGFRVNESSPALATVGSLGASVPSTSQFGVIPLVPIESIDRLHQPPLIPAHGSNISMVASDSQPPASDAVVTFGTSGPALASSSAIMSKVSAQPSPTLDSTMMSSSATSRGMENPSRHHTTDEIQASASSSAAPAPRLVTTALAPSSSTAATAHSDTSMNPATGSLETTAPPSRILSSAPSGVTSAADDLPTVMSLPKRPHMQDKQLSLPAAVSSVPSVATSGAEASEFHSISPMAQWYNSNTGSSFERYMLPEWFDRSAPHRTLETFVKTRERIIAIARRSQGKYVTATAVRHSVAGDAGSLLRLHEFLTRWGFINGDASADSAPSSVEMRKDPPLKVQVKKAVEKPTWTAVRRYVLAKAVVDHANKRKKVDGGQSESSGQKGPVTVDWKAVATKVGGDMTPSDCRAEFLSLPLDGSDEEISSKDSRPSHRSDSDNGKQQQKEEILHELLDGVRPEVIRAATQAALGAADSLAEAQKAITASTISVKALKRAREEEDAVSALLREILDQRMSKFENRMALLDDMEGMLEAERVAIELERRDLYTARCRHWFGGGN